MNKRLMNVALALLLCANVVSSQPVNDQEWHPDEGILSGVITISCPEFALPIDLGRVLSEPDPINVEGEMSGNSRAPFPVKVRLTPESGPSDTLTQINGCSEDGNEVWLTAHNSGESITVSSGGNIDLSSAVVLDDDTILQLVLTNGVYKLLGTGGSGGGGGGGTLDQAFDAGNEMDNVPCSRPVRVSLGGDDFIDMCIETGDIPRIIGTCNGATCDTVDNIILGIVYERQHQGTVGLRIDDNYNVTLLGNAVEVHSLFIPAWMFSTDGTQCTDPTERNINGRHRAPSIVCADNDNGTLFAEIPSMPFKWDEGQIELQLIVVSTAPTPSSNYAFDWAVQCTDLNAAEPLDTTFGTETRTLVNFDNGGSCGNNCVQFGPVMATTGSISIQGAPCTDGSFLSILGALDSTATTVTDTSEVEIKGVKFIWTANDYSD